MHSKGSKLQSRLAALGLRTGTKKCSSLLSSFWCQVLGGGNECCAGGVMAISGVDQLLDPSDVRLYS